MAIGFTPKYKEEFALSGFTPQQYIALALSAAKSLNWEILEPSNIGFTALTRGGLFSDKGLIKFKIVENLVSIESSSLGNAMVDFGKNKKNVGRLLEAIKELEPNFTIEELDQQYTSLARVPDELDVLQQTPPTAKENFKDFIGLFVPREGYFVTPLIVDLNLLIFAVMAFCGVGIFEPESESLINWGANFKPETLNQPWRLITNCFLHIGIFHLLMNVYALIYIGLLLEPYLGKLRFLSAYLLAGIAASVASLWWHDLTISAGASGAIFGMYGVFLAMLTTNLIDESVRKNLLTSISVFVGYNLLYGLKGGIDNAAHLGGLFSGLVIGYVMIPSLKRYEILKLKLATIAMLCLLILSTSFAVYKSMPNNIAEYDKRIKPFAYNESMAMEVFNLPENTSQSKTLYEIKDRGIYYWKENIKLINELDTMDLPEVFHKKHALLINYCQLRIKYYEVLYKAIEEDTEKYKSELEGYNGQIEAVIKKFEAQ